MTRRKQGQRVLWEGMIDEDVRALWEPWMIQADRLLEDEELIDRVYEAQGERHQHSATKGRSQTPAEMVLRLLLLKHVRNWSFDKLEREVRMNLCYRDFARIGMGKVADAKTLARIAQALGGEVIAELHRRLVEIAQEEGVIQGRKMRVDTTVVETNIHYPTDSSLLGDGARVLTRTMQKIETRAGQLKRKVRNRTRSVSKRVIAIATASRHKGPEGEAKRKKQYKELLRFSRQVLNDTKRVLAEVEQMSRKKKKGLRGLCEHLSEMAGRVRQVVKQAKVRVFEGITDLPGKIVSLFEPHSEIIRKGKASKPTEFGKMVQVQETENQIITHYDVFDRRPSDRDLLLGAVETLSVCWAECRIWPRRTRDIIRARKNRLSKRRA
jgi:IS5 family transposase